MLLSNLGVPDEVFIALQNDMLERLAGKQNKACEHMDNLSFLRVFVRERSVKSVLLNFLGDQKPKAFICLCSHLPTALSPFITIKSLSLMGQRQQERLKISFLAHKKVQ